MLCSLSRVTRGLSSAAGLCRLTARRTFLSEAFNCDAAWQQRLQQPALAAIDATNIEQFFVETDRRMTKSGRGSAIDMDIFANVTTANYLEHLEQTMINFRKTLQTCETLPSTYYAICRAFISYGAGERLAFFLSDRLKYGLFPDHVSLIYMMNHFLKQQNYRESAKVAVFMMLQEELNEYPIAREMAAYSAYRFALQDSPELIWEPLEPEPEPEPEDDVKVRVDYLDSPWTDSHFDLKEKTHLVGKTLCELANKESDAYVKKSLQVMGWAMFEKWGELADMEPAEADADCLSKAKDIVERSDKCDVKEAVVGALTAMKAGASIEDTLKGRLEASISEHEGSYIKWQEEQLAAWNGRREEALKRQYDAFAEEARREELGRLKSEFDEKEKQLFYFDRVEEFEQFNSDKIQEWRRKLPKRTWTRKITRVKKDEVSMAYIPPEIGRQ